MRHHLQTTIAFILFTIQHGFDMNHQANQSAAVNRRPDGQWDSSGNLSATVAADRALPAAVAELVRYLLKS